MGIPESPTIGEILKEREEATRIATLAENKRVLDKLHNALKYGGVFALADEMNKMRESLRQRTTSEIIATIHAPKYVTNTERVRCNNTDCIDYNKELCSPWKCSYYLQKHDAGISDKAFNDALDLVLSESYDICKWKKWCDDLHQSCSRPCDFFESRSIKVIVESLKNSHEEMKKEVEE
ncbi:MAG: hypothetical protein EHM34_06225 [Nitrosopumilales archaeon]|nr:MAG: hypothetical protein EHM34_06225 [Nitrosopumilales archaeon]